MNDGYLHNAHPTLSPVAPPESLTPHVHDLFHCYCYTHIRKYKHSCYVHSVLLICVCVHG